VKNLIGSPLFWRMVGTTSSVPGGYVEEEASMSIKSLQPTKPFVTALADARPAPNVFAAEADVIQTE